MNEWENEPDQLDWREQQSGYQCLIWRSPDHLYLNGVVELLPSHPLFGADKSELGRHKLGDRPVLGFAFPNKSISRFWRKNVWRVQISFNGDCELWPSMTLNTEKLVYRNIDYAKRETEVLARRLAARDR